MKKGKKQESEISIKFKVGVKIAVVQKDGGGLSGLVLVWLNQKERRYNFLKGKSCAASQNSLN